MKYYGKEKCRILKEIRAEIARQNDIEWVTSECRHRGNCQGTCPKCEAEVRELEAALAKRAALGKRVAVVGISAAISLAVTACEPELPAEMGEPLPPKTESATNEPLMGDIYVPPDTDVTAGVPMYVETDEEGEETAETAETVPIMGDMPTEGGGFWP